MSGSAAPLDLVLGRAEGALTHCLRLAAGVQGQPRDAALLATLIAALADARRLLAEAQAAPPPAPPPPLQLGMTFLPTALGTAREATPTAGAEGLWDGAEQAGADARDPGGDLSSVPFGELMEGLGRSVAAAQRTLDEEALRQHASLAQAGAAGLPTLYRMPRVKAEFRFAFEKQGTKGINLVFWRDMDVQTSRNAQTIELEIVAVPMPPEMAGNPDVAALPRGELVLDQTARKAMVAALPASLVPDAGNGQPGADGVLLMRVGPANWHGPVFALVPAKGEVRLAVLVPELNGYGAAPNPPAALAVTDPRVADALRGMAEAQSRVLKTLHG